MSKFYVNCQNKKILAEKVFKIIPKDENVLDEVLLYVEDCPNKGDKNTHCLYCKGICVESRKEIFNPKLNNFEIKATLIKDKTIKDKAGRIVDVNRATDYLESSLQIFELKPREYNNTSGYKANPYRAMNGITDNSLNCIECKRKHKEEEKETPCGLATEYYKNEPTSALTIEECVCRFQYAKIVTV